MRFVFLFLHEENNQLFFLASTIARFIQEMFFFFFQSWLFFSIQGRATLVSGSKRQPISQNIPATTSSPTLVNVEHIRRYSLSRQHSEQASNNASGTSTPENHGRVRRGQSSIEVPIDQEDLLRNLDSVRSNSSATTPKSLRESQEQPVNLNEQPPMTGKVNVQILSPNSDRVRWLVTDLLNISFCSI